jgi:hypothetical protein
MSTRFDHRAIARAAGPAKPVVLDSSLRSIGGLLLLTSP